MRFPDRQAAARELATRLARWRGAEPLILAIPRGAVPMGRIIADDLEGELDVVLVRKLGAPGNPEFALGAVDERGECYFAPHVGVQAVKDGYLQSEIARQREQLRRRRQRYTPHRAPIDPADRVTIVVDDGIATGSTMIAALRATRARNPRRLIAATAVASPDALQAVEAEADEVVCLHAPAGFMAVGQFFERFEQVEDDEVVKLLARSG